MNYLMLCTSVLSIGSDTTTPHGMAVQKLLSALRRDYEFCVSPTALQDLNFGRMLAMSNGVPWIDDLDRLISTASSNRVFEITEETAVIGGEVKAKIAERCIPKKIAEYRKWPACIQNWVIAATSQRLGLSEGDLLMCALAIQHQATLLTAKKAFGLLREVIPSLTVIQISQDGSVSTKQLSHCHVAANRKMGALLPQRRGSYNGDRNKQL